MRQRTDASFSHFYKDVVDTAINKNIGKPELPRYRRALARLDNGSQPHRFGTPEDYYRNLYFEACDLLIRELEDRFQVKECLSPVLSLENLLLQAANGESYENDLKGLQSTCYREDINLEQLQKQLPLLVDKIRQALPKVSRVTSVRTICEAMNTQNVYKSMLAQVHNLLRLYLTVPITSATSERTFSALRRILTYLRSSMSEQGLNNCMLLHIHKDLTDACDMEQVARDFISVNSERRNYFGRF